ncbi:magnesium-chelatase 38 kDa subunit [Sporomusaceae bacterium FL31]|nr:magnesium-chelatase 38 kDa subunit [Sporomusaceae bacterium FL31]GCE35034.1 magnesium-chelatase 38 kDa subunit [Sporomusaceae bacterium]
MRSYYDLISHEGNQSLFKAIEMSIAAQVNHYPLHFHVEGLRGTGKTTIIRAAKSILPPIIRIKGCCYNCHPTSPHCPEHRYLSSIDVQKLGTEIVPRPFLEISHSAKIGTVVGSIDLGKLTDSNNPAAALLPGTIPRAHRGIIFIDEINRLADTSPELADMLLDLMGTKPGRVQIEETGLATVELPLSVSIWAASNPDEDPGPLQQIRKQLSDRFDLNVYMGRPQKIDTVRNILIQKNNYSNKKEKHQELQVGDLREIVIHPHITDILAGIYIEFGIESLRAVEALELAAKLLSLQTGRKSVTIADISQIVPLVLSHRVDAGTIEKILVYLRNLELQNEKEPCKTKSMIQVELKKTSPKYSWVKSFWENVRKKLSTNRGGLSGNHSADNDNNQSSGQSTLNCPSSNSIAPPKRATPLEELPNEKIISVDTK